MTVDNTITSQPPRRARHLMDPANPQRPVNDHRLTVVQQWTMSVLAVTTILHMSIGLVVATMLMDEQYLAPRIGLNIIAAAFGVLALVSGFAIHKHKILNWWLVLGVLPSIFGIWYVLSH